MKECLSSRILDYLQISSIINVLHVCDTQVLTEGKKGVCVCGVGVVNFNNEILFWKHY